MPKLKTKSSAKKRFRFTASGKIKMPQAGKRHGMIKRTNSQIRKQRGTTIMSKQDSNTKTLEFEERHNDITTEADSDEAELNRANFIIKHFPNLMSKEEQIRTNFLLKQLEGVSYPKSDETLKNCNYNNNNGYFSKDYDTLFSKLVPIVG